MNKKLNSNREKPVQLFPNRTTHITHLNCWQLLQNLIDKQHNLKLFYLILNC